MIIPSFDREFVKKWERTYYQCDKDYEDEKNYRSLIKLVNSDVTGKSTLSKNSLREILKWKLGERYGQEDNVDWQRYEIIYVPRFKIIISGALSDHHKLLVLLWDAKKLKSQLPDGSGVLDGIQGKPKGFGVPVASLFVVRENGTLLRQKLMDT